MTDIFESIIDRNFDVGYKDESGHTALHYARTRDIYSSTTFEYGSLLNT